MALSLHRSSSTWLFSIQVLFVSVGAVSLAVLSSSYLPAMVEFAANEVPARWASVVAWLRPPYLYLIINVIIISIVVSSRLQSSGGCVSQAAAVAAVPEPDFTPALSGGRGDDGVSDIGMDESSAVYEDRSPSGDDRAWEAKPVVVSGLEADDEGEVAISVVTERTGLVEIPMEYVSPVERISPAEKPLVFTRIGRRKSLQPRHEGGKTLNVAKPRRHETLENTWKMIMEGRAMPLTRHTYKCDTWERDDRRVDPSLEDPSPDSKTAMTKSNTLRDRSNHLPARAPLPGSVRLRKEPSPSQDELNRRVEAFIKKFNEEMRLQRQASLDNQYSGMINP